MPIRKVGEAAAHSHPAHKEPRAIPLSKKTLIIAFPDNREICVEFTPNLTKADIAFVAQKITEECK